MKQIIKELTPPLLLKYYRQLKGGSNRNRKVANSNVWRGNFLSWKEALQNSVGYDHSVILEKCKNALLKVKNGEAKYERDSVLFDNIEYSWPLLAALQRAAIDNNNHLSVLDFGGSLGSTYYQNKFFLNNLNSLNWHIVEQKNFVEEGKAHFEDEILKFFYTVEESLQKQKPDIVVLSSVLQYLELPYAMLDKIFSLGSRYVVIDKTAFIDYPTDILTVQDVPEEIYQASYPAWFFSSQQFQKKIKGYEILAQFNAYEGYVIPLENQVYASYKGYILKQKHDR